MNAHTFRNKNDPKYTLSTDKALFYFYYTEMVVSAITNSFFLFCFVAPQLITP